MPLRFPARKTGAAAVLALGVAAFGCGDGGPVVPAPTGRVTFELDHAVGTDPLAFDTIRYLNAAGNRYAVMTLRYYLSNLELVRADGGVFEVGGVHYRDARAVATRDWVAAGVPNGAYRAIRFTFGLDSQRNVAGGLPATQDNINMQWPDVLGGGYHYMQLDGTFERAGVGIEGWQAHLGRLQRDVDPAPMPHFFAVELPVAGLQVQGDAWRLPVVMDVNEWFANPSLFDFITFGGFVMSNPVAEQLLDDNGRDVFSAGGVTREAP